MILPPPFHIDGFAGGGGASEGFEFATGIPVAMAFNHAWEALAMHRMNHPMTKHFCEDIRRVDILKLVLKWGLGRAVTSAWFSPDCKDFSKAKGGKPKSKRIRGLAWTIIDWIIKLGPLAPLVFYMENVEEFLEWCPLLKDGRRNPKLLGWFFKCFVGALRRRGYVVEWRIMRASDYSSSPTIRKRLYLVARRDGRPIVWPDHSYGEGKLNKQKVAADILDFELPCPSIFMTRRQATAYRKRTGIKLQRPLARASLKRIAKGVERYVMKAADPFFVGHAQHKGASRSARAPLHTVSASPKDANLLMAAHLVKITTGSVGSSVRLPFPTITAGSWKKRPGGNPPLAVLSTFLAQNNTGMVGHDIREPVSTIAGKGSNQSFVACGMVKYYGADQDPRMEEPLHSVTTRDRFGLFNARVIPVMTPEIEVMARRVAKFLRRFGVKFEGEFAMCGDLVIYDIGMRMLIPRELYRAQGFGDDYIIDRGMDIDEETGRLFEIKLTKSDQVRMVGNSVCPPMACALIRANQPEYALQEIAA
jgi:DNA (cytosine-5)-methyltransferase 1